MAIDIPKLRIARMATVTRISTEQPGQRRRAMLVDHDEFMDHMANKGHLPARQIDITNSTYWLAYSWRGVSLILIWQ